MRIVFLSGVPSFTPLVRGTFAGLPGEPGAFPFLFNNELKKLAKTPSPVALPGGSLASICEKIN